MIQENQSNIGNTPTGAGSYLLMPMNTILPRTEDIRPVMAHDQLIAMNLQEQHQLHFQQDQSYLHQQHVPDESQYAQSPGIMQQSINYNNSNTNSPQLIVDVHAGCFGTFLC